MPPSTVKLRPPLEQMTLEGLIRYSKQGLVPFFRDIPADVETPVSVCLKLGNPKERFLLESVEGGEKWARYSILSDKARVYVRLMRDRAEIRHGKEKEVIKSAQPLLTLRKVWKDHRVAKVERLPHFVGGLVGYLSYSAVHWFETRVPQRLGDDPEFPVAEWMLPERLVIFDNVRHCMTLVTLVDVKAHRSAKIAYKHATAALDDLQKTLAKGLKDKAEEIHLSNIKEPFAAEAFKKAVNKAKNYIRAGDCMQVVLSRRLEARLKGSPFELYRAMRQVTPAPYLFYLGFGKRILSGASPELLFSLWDKKLTVRPIAGTRKRGKTAEEDERLEAELRADPKERAEHVMLVDLGRNDVGRVSEKGSVQVEEQEVVDRFSHVMHLVSQVSGELRKGLDSLDALAAVFPAGTLSGAPKVRAMEIIDEMEPQPRGPYAGAVGWISQDAADLAIVIRALAVNGDKLRVQAGAGLVYDSKPAFELEETRHKMAGVLTALGVFDAGKKKQRKK